MTRESQSRREASGEAGSRRGTTRVTLRLDDCAATESTTARLPMVSHLAFGYPSRSRDVYPCPHSPRAECANFSSSLISRLLTCFVLDPAAAARASQQIELHTAAGTRHRASASAASPSAHLTFDCGLFTFGRAWARCLPERRPLLLPPPTLLLVQHKLSFGAVIVGGGGGAHSTVWW